MVDPTPPEEAGDLVRSHMVADGEGALHTPHYSTAIAKLQNSKRLNMPQWRPRSGHTAKHTKWLVVLKRVCKVLKVNIDDLDEQRRR